MQQTGPFAGFLLCEELLCSTCLSKTKKCCDLVACAFPLDEKKATGKFCLQEPGINKPLQDWPVMLKGRNELKEEVVQIKKIAFSQLQHIKILSSAGSFGLVFSAEY